MFSVLLHCRMRCHLTYFSMIRCSVRRMNSSLRTGMPLTVRPSAWTGTVTSSVFGGWGQGRFCRSMVVGGACLKQPTYNMDTCTLRALEEVHCCALAAFSQRWYKSGTRTARPLVKKDNLKFQVGRRLQVPACSYRRWLPRAAYPNA